MVQSRSRVATKRPGRASRLRRAKISTRPRRGGRVESQDAALKLLTELAESDDASTLGRPQLLRLSKLAVACTFAPGAVLVNEGDPSDAVYLIISGEVEILQRDGEHTHLIERGYTEFVGEIGVLENEPRSATVRAWSEVQALRFDKLAFLSLMSTAPFLVWKLVRSVNARLRRREQEYMGELQLRNQELADAATRLQDMNNALERLVAQRTRELAEANGRLEDLVATDELTGLYNRRFLHQVLENKAATIAQISRPFSVVMIDVDHFKHYNDRNGHLAGDDVLHSVAQLLLTSVRSGDMVARYGGEEFCLVLENTTKLDAMSIAVKLRHAVAEYPFPDGGRQPLGQFTISLGVATYPDDAATVLDTLRAADVALYRAKDAGRNREVSYSEPVALPIGAEPDLVHNAAP
jgi:diguanylate cyclase (GGDEF)-like protein